MTGEIPCFCSRCKDPGFRVAGKVSVCSACGQEIRFGVREGVTAWHHREVVDHVPRHGHAVVATQPGVGAEPPPPLTPEEEAKEALQAAKVEIWARDFDPAELPPRSGIKQIVNLVQRTEGWELVGVRYSRGPYRGANGKVLSISDIHVVKARLQKVDGDDLFAIGSWRDLAFDYAYIGTIRHGRARPERVASNALKDWIKGTPTVDNESNG